MSEIREPIKKTSIEKKNKIIEKGFELICEKGYYNITSVDIAKYAGVSTGIIYQYFNDKRDILIEGVKKYSDNILFPMLSYFKNEKLDDKHFKKSINEIIDLFTENHKMSKKAHEELMALSHLDEEISQIFKNQEIELTEKLEKAFKQNGKKVRKENIHIANNIIEDFCHEVVYHEHEQLNYKVMKEKVVELVAELLS